MEHYQSYQTIWEEQASVRTKPRRILTEEDQNTYYFPPEQALISIHPLVEKSGMKDKFLIHSMHKYLNDIANIEKDIINDTACQITKNAFNVEFPLAARHDALSIIIDESYHAYVALDYSNQVAEKTGVFPVFLPEETPLSEAMKHIKTELPENLVKDFFLITTCIAEHALTNDLVKVAKSKDVKRSFFFIMQDHALDEGRHARFFEQILAFFWASMSENDKNLIGSFIPVIVHEYFNPALQKKYDTAILQQLGFAKKDVETIINDTYAIWSVDNINEENIIVKRMISLLKRTGVFEHPIVKAGFESFNVK